MTDTPSPPPGAQAPAFKCPKCERVFDNQHNLDAHLLTHTTPPPTPKESKLENNTPKAKDETTPPPAQPKKLVIESTPEQEEVVHEILPDIFKKAEEEAKKEAKTEQDAEKGIDQIFGTLQAKWNEVADTKPPEQGGNPADAYKLTDDDMKSLKNGIMLMDGKYHFLGKSLNYIPEIALSIAIITIAFKGYKMVQAKRSSGGGSTPRTSSGDKRMDDVQARVDAIMAEIQQRNGTKV